jgi:hypothetical protein
MSLANNTYDELEAFVPTHKIETRLVVEVPNLAMQSGVITLEPKIIEAKWTRNNHLIADELTVTIGWKEGGIDPRHERYARCAFWLWDSNREDYDEDKHLRFTGIAKRVERKIADNGAMVVDVTFHDFTRLFLDNKPLNTKGMPLYTDTLRQAWERLCDYTGYWDPDNSECLSTVKELRDALVVLSPQLEGEIEGRTIGELVNERFLKIARPQPKSGASSWDVWQWICGALGLVSYIDRDRVVVTDTVEHFTKEQAPRVIYGYNITDLHEVSDAANNKGVLVKSFDPLHGRILEAFYPPPGDDRLKVRRAALGKKSEGGATITPNEVSADYEEFVRWEITDQKALDRVARATYEERVRSEMNGSFKTAEYTLFTREGEEVDLLSLGAGDPISVEIDERLRELLEDVASRSSATWGSRDTIQMQYLVDFLGYDPGMAELIVANLKVDNFRVCVFHVSALDVHVGPETYEVEVKFHNLIPTDD